MAQEISPANITVSSELIRSSQLAKIFIPLLQPSERCGSPMAKMDIARLPFPEYSKSFAPIILLSRPRELTIKENMYYERF